PNEASEGEGDFTLSQQFGPFTFPDNVLPGVGTPGVGDPGANNSQGQDPSLINQIGGPVSLAQGAETVTHPLLSLSGARALNFSLSYNSQLSGGNKLITPSGGGATHWTLYTPGDVGHWTHSFEGQAAEFTDSAGAVN